MADHDKTALQLAEAVARRVIRMDHGLGPEVESDDGYFEGDEDIFAGVLGVLREHGVWFCRLSETPQGTTQERLPMGDEE